MKRRSFLHILGRRRRRSSSAAPRLSLAQNTRVLKFVPQANLSSMDAVAGTQYVVRNASAMVWDTLYGMDDKLLPQRQMVESEEVSADGLTWTFRLRPGLKFHDGEGVLAKDAVASINRWAARDPMGLMLKAVENELTAADDRTFRWVLKRPFPKMLLALGKITTPCCFIMPARIAATDPFKQIGDYVGSGPMRFVRNEWVPGAKAVFEKFPGYVPRQEPGSWLAGGKRILVDRIEWIVIPDQATAAAALQSGEIDWWESPISDLVPLLRKNRNVAVDIADPLGNIGVFRMNHLYPPFNDVRARRAILTAMSQQDYMQALVGDDDRLWKPLPSFFTPGTPLYTEEGGDVLKGPRNFDAAKKLLAQSGYSGQPVDLPGGAGHPNHQGARRHHCRPLEASRHECRFRRARLGHGRRPPRRQDAARPGRLANVPHLDAGADCMNPASDFFIRANGDKAWFGWPDVPEVEAQVSAWLEAKTSPTRKGRGAPAQQGRVRQRGLCADRLLPASTRPGAKTSPASSKARCRSSGASARRRDGLREVSSASPALV